MKAALQLDVTFEQVLALVKQLPRAEKVKLTEALASEDIDARLSKLLKTFRTNDLSMDTITQEVEAVRQDMYDRRKR